MIFFGRSVAQRRLQPELMDQPGLEAGGHRQALRDLSRINFCSLTARHLWKPLCDLHRRTGTALKVLDIAAGGGDVVCRLARMARLKNAPIAFAGCDVSPVAVDYSRSNARVANVDVDFFVADVIGESVPSGFDVVMCSLFLHHLTEEQAVMLMSEMAAKAERAILISDLIRSRSGLWLAQIGTRVLSSSPVVQFDGPRSVEGAFRREEVCQLAARAGLINSRITPVWPRRFLLTWYKEVSHGEL